MTEPPVCLTKAERLLPANLARIGAWVPYVAFDGLGLGNTAAEAARGPIPGMIADLRRAGCMYRPEVAPPACVLTLRADKLNTAKVRRRPGLAPGWDFPGFRYKAAPAVQPLLMDLRNPEYRAWAAEASRVLVEATGADGVEFSAKTFWYEDASEGGSDEAARAFGWPRQSPYGPGEFVEAMRAYVRELHALGVVALVQELPIRRDQYTNWSPGIRVRAQEARQ